MADPFEDWESAFDAGQQVRYARNIPRRSGPHAVPPETSSSVEEGASRVPAQRAQHGTYSRELLVAIKAVRAASRACIDILRTLSENKTIIKDDKSPVTIADFTAQAVVNCILANEFPDDKNVGEEVSEGLSTENEGKTLASIVSHTNHTLSSNYSANQVMEFIDRGKYEGGAVGRHWVLDPIDGTKGFLRGDQFAV
ncbi:3'(2'),5'-bisphosphate nucleotidase 2, partial [Smittium mucronatum]